MDPSGNSFWSSVGDFFGSVGEAINSAVDWIEEHAVEILTVVVIVLVVVVVAEAIVATGGLAAGALVGAAAGGLEQAVACATGCGGVENLFLPVAQGVYRRNTGCSQWKARGQVPGISRFGR